MTYRDRVDQLPAYLHLRDTPIEQDGNTSVLPAVVFRREIASIRQALSGRTNDCP